MPKHKAGSLVIIHGNNGFQEVKVTGSRTVLRSGWKPVRFYWLQVAEDCFALEIHENYVWESRQAIIEFYINSIANDKKNYQNQIHKAKQLIQFSENYVQGLESRIQSWQSLLTKDVTDNDIHSQLAKLKLAYEPMEKYIQNVQSQLQTAQQLKASLDNQIKTLEGKIK